MISIQSWKDFRNGDFKTLYATGSADGTIKPVVRAKPAKKSKEQEQSDFQKEILKKPYTTNLIKQKEEDNRLKIQQETVTATTASQAKG